MYQTCVNTLVKHASNLSQTYSTNFLPTCLFFSCVRDSDDHCFVRLLLHSRHSWPASGSDGGRSGVDQGKIDLRNLQKKNAAKRNSCLKLTSSDTTLFSVNKITNYKSKIYWKIRETFKWLINYLVCFSLSSKTLILLKGFNC